jgi:hypothetical protein
MHTVYVVWGGTDTTPNLAINPGIALPI